MKTLLTLFLFQFITQNFIYIEGRSASAMNDICSRFPNLPACKEDEVEQTTYPQTNAPESRDTFTNIGNNNYHQESNDYCTKYQPKYTSYCHGNKMDTVIVQFCGNYLYKCATSVQFGTQAPATNGPPSKHQGSSSSYWKSLNLSPEDISRYCNMYGRDYKHCMGPRIQSDAVEFCSAYRDLCTAPTNEMDLPVASVQSSHVAPNQRTTYIASRQQTPNQRTTYIAPRQQTPPNQSPFGFPVDGDFGDMLGIPNDGDGPMAGLGGMNNLNIPYYGGPVDGGLGFGRSVFAPFFDGNKGFNIVPTKSFTEGQRYRFAGMSAGGGSGVDWSGTPGLSVLNGALGLNGNSPSIGRYPGQGK